MKEEFGMDSSVRVGQIGYRKHEKVKEGRRELRTGLADRDTDTDRYTTVRNEIDISIYTPTSTQPSI